MAPNWFRRRRNHRRAFIVAMTPDQLKDAEALAETLDAMDGLPADLKFLFITPEEQDNDEQ